MAWERMKDPSGAARRAIEVCECAVLSSRIEDRKAPVVCRACCNARLRYLVVSPSESFIVGRGSRSGDCTCLTPCTITRAL